MVVDVLFAEIPKQVVELSNETFDVSAGFKHSGLEQFQGFVKLFLLLSSQCRTELTYLLNSLVVGCELLIKIPLITAVKPDKDRERHYGNAQ